MTVKQLQTKIEEVRSFNRFYTKKIGLLDRGLLKTRFSLTQARIIFELAQQDKLTANELICELSIDKGYISRILDSFMKSGLIRKTKSKSDNRKKYIELTTKGRKAYSQLNNRSTGEIKVLLQNLSGEEQHRIAGAMNAIEKVLDDKQSTTDFFILRPHIPGDIGWITHRHGVVYYEEYGWDETFEALVGEILVKFVRKHDPKRERIWIAEHDGERVGSIMIVDAGDQVAQLRLLIVESKVRGKGLGNRLISECISFSRSNNYKKIRLWTQNNLLEARHLYVKAGFELIEEKKHKSFGKDLVAEIWELTL
ncbi:MAG: MarR family transcriptional regulator [bacterium]|nr:MarR family transcriptional regulator [bacterium]